MCLPGKKTTVHSHHVCKSASEQVQENHDPLVKSSHSKHECNHKVPLSSCQTLGITRSKVTLHGISLIRMMIIYTGKRRPTHSVKSLIQILCDMILHLHKLPEHKHYIAKHRPALEWRTRSCVLTSLCRPYPYAFHHKMTSSGVHLPEVRHALKYSWEKEGGEFQIMSCSLTRQQMCMD